MQYNQIKLTLGQYWDYQLRTQFIKKLSGYGL